MDKMTIKQFKSSLVDDLKVMPEWVDSKSSLFYMIWNDTMLLINNEILKLITSSILTERVVFKIVSNVNCYLDMVDEITTSEIRMEIVTYYSTLFLYIKDRSLEEDLFEITANIQRFTDIYYNITNI